MVHRPDYFGTDCILQNFIDRDYFVSFGGLAGLYVFGFSLLRLLQLWVIARANAQPDDVMNVLVPPSASHISSVYSHMVCCSLMARFGVHAVSAPVRRYLLGPRVVDTLRPNASCSIIAASWCFLPRHD
ncbi:hypothetical protein R1flu_012268 [Riccia fluitans]|uniref:Uncharacterized protein n=1 Tax=Riccia fluitans TaxID=41844 RepID=A0ABD1ZA77_9MARC